MEAKTVRWIELMRLAEDAYDATYQEHDDGIEAQVRVGAEWYQARAHMPLSPRPTRWGIDEDGFAYYVGTQGREYPNLAITSWASALALEAIRPEIVRVLREAPEPYSEALTEAMEAFRYISLIDSSALDEFEPGLCQALRALEKSGADPHDEDDMRWKLYLHRVRGEPRYASRVAQSREQQVKALQLDRVTFLAELEARGFRRLGA